MTSKEALNILDNAVKFVNATREQHAIINEAVQVLKTLVEKESNAN